ncbi:MAG: sulfate permease [Methylococcales bacterium]|jgi:sulfate permease, SulP family|nr:sulfate permease [Methylococcales bacterium]
MITPQTVKKDFFAGLTGAVVVLPQGVAFATIAGLPPQYGLYTAMVTPIFAALFGSSLHLISGPTTAISIVIFSTMSQHAQPGSPEFIQLTITVTFLAGVYQLAFGLARLGVLVNFVSHTVVVAFTTGAALLIATSQIGHILNIGVPKGIPFIEVWQYVILHLTEFSVAALSIAATTLVVALAAKKLSPKLPHLLIGLIAGSTVCYFFTQQAQLVPMVGEIPAQLPPLSMPDLTFATIRELAPQAFAIALLGLIEAVSIAKSISSKSQQRINGNQEFVGQGISNVAGSFFSSYAGSGSFTRSGINYSAGAQTPLSAIFAAIMLVLIVLLVSPVTAYLPNSAMAGVILLVAYNLVDFKHIKKIVRVSRSETAVLVVTFLATLFLHLEFAIYIGVILSLMLFLARTSAPEIITLAPDPEDSRRRMTDVGVHMLPECPQLKIVRVDMSIYFGSVDSVQDRLEEVFEKQGIKHLLLIGTGINFVDLAGAEMLIQLQKRLQSMGGGLYFCRLKPPVYAFLAKSGMAKLIGNDYFYSREVESIISIYQKLDQDICKTCPAKIFKECHGQEYH